MQASYFKLIAKHRQQGVLIDTNLMLLLVIGTYSSVRIASFKRTVKYTYSDYLLVADISGRFARRFTTPNIMTEVDNLSRQASEAEHAAIAHSFARVMTELIEIYVPSETALRHPLFPKIGLADTATTFLPEEALVLTDDLPLANRLSSMGRAVININHLRL